MTRSDRFVLYNNSKSERWNFKIEAIERGETHETDLFLLTRNGEDFMIYKSDLKKTAREFPDSVRYEHNLTNKSFVSIPEAVCQRIMGRRLKPMNSDCLEPIF